MSADALKRARERRCKELRREDPFAYIAEVRTNETIIDMLAFFGLRDEDLDLGGSDWRERKRRIERALEVMHAALVVAWQFNALPPEFYGRARTSSVLKRTPK